MDNVCGIGAQRHPISFGRRLLEFASRGVVLKRKLPKRVGGRTIWLSPEASSLRAWKFDLEGLGSGLFDAAQELVNPGDCVWDVGANIGLFSFSAAYFAGRAGCVLAIEPDLFSVGLLRRSNNSPHCGSSAISILPLAVADKLALSQFHIAKRARSSNFLHGFGSTEADGSREEQTVPTISLNWLAEQTNRLPEVIKIDVEGAECLVLAGGRELIRKARPKIHVEVSEQNVAWVGDFFQSHRYTIFDADNRGNARQREAQPSWNTIAIPEESTEVLQARS